MTTLRPKTPGKALPPIPSQWVAPHKHWVDWLAAGALREATLYQRNYQLRRIALDHANRSPWELTTEDLAAWLAAQGWSREALRSYRATLRSFYAWAHASELTTRNPALLLRSIKPTQPRPRPAAERDIDTALRIADPSTRLAIEIASRYGLRRSEVAAIHSRDLRVDDVEGHLIEVHGKGGKSRDIPISANHAMVIRSAQGFLFPSPRRRGHHLTAAVLGKRMSQCLPDGVTPHQLRHRFATTIFQRGVDLVTIKDLLGHASVATTQIYVQPRHDAARQAIQLAV